MVFDDLCLKIYFWPVLSYLATLKGLCPLYPHGFFPIITLPPVTDTTMTSPIPSIQPTPPTTLPPCPADPLVCLANGERPIEYCPCIDPRQQNPQSTMMMMMMMEGETMENNMNLESLQLRLAVNYPTTAVTPIETMTFSALDKTKRSRKRKKRQITKDEIVN